MKNDPSTIAVMLLVVAILLYTGVITPLTSALNKARMTLSQEEIRLSSTRIAVSQMPDVKSRIGEFETKTAENRKKLLSPLLNSYAMRAKSLLGDMAHQAGLLNVEYEEGGFRALPVPKEQLPRNRTGRRSVCVKAQADYAAIASFILRAERELPLMTVQALTITPASKAGADRQEAEMILEWPCEGEGGK